MILRASGRCPIVKDHITGRFRIEIIRRRTLIIVTMSFPSSHLSGLAFILSQHPCVSHYRRLVFVADGTYAVLDFLLKVSSLPSVCAVTLRGCFVSLSLKVSFFSMLLACCYLIAPPVGFTTLLVKVVNWVNIRMQRSSTLILSEYSPNLP
jgi:hypothetical protein